MFVEISHLGGVERSPNPIPTCLNPSFFSNFSLDDSWQFKVGTLVLSAPHEPLVRASTSGSLKMSALEMSHSHGGADLEQGGSRRRSSAGSVCFSDADEGSCYSQFYSTTGGSYDDSMFAEIGNGSGSRRVSTDSDCSVEVVVVVENENKVQLGKVERDCRICHLGLESNSHESGLPIELGCSCKDDLAAAHKHCAETWFKIKGNKTCEICHSLARNVAGATEIETVEQSPNENNSSTAVLASIPNSETRSIWHGHRFLNFLLACMVFAFVISWLFHFNVPASS